MNSKYDLIRKEIESLIADGNKLNQYLSNDIEDFLKNYQQWYTKSLETIRQLIPNRLDDFKVLYKNEKRKPQSPYAERDISQYLSGDTVPEQYISLKVLQQINILISAHERLDSVLFEIKNIVQADIFDSEIESSRYLLKEGFLRASGAICGVILEKHFETVCSNHNLKIPKKDPKISDYNDCLKNVEIIQTDMWRFVQRMGDLRNLCDHNKKQEPTIENVQDLIDGTDKIIKSIF